jgi:hypothetical protein
MSESKSGGNLLSRFKAFLQGLGKPKDNLVLRTKSTASPNEGCMPPESEQDGGAGPAALTDNRTSLQTPKSESGIDQWQKLKHTAKASDSGESNLDHWNQKQGGILSGTTFDAASTDLSHGSKPRKRPSVVTQARITSNRLQALQVQMEKPKNDVDEHIEDEFNT